MRVLLAIFALSIPQFALGQSQTLFETAVGECARFIVAQPQSDWDFPTPPASVQTDQEYTSASVVYPQGSASGFDVAVSYSYSKAASGGWNCAGTGPKAPAWESFVATEWVGADALVRAAGLVALNFEPPQRAYSNCTAEEPNIYWVFDGVDGDGVTFAATTGPVAATFCSSLGWEE